MIDSAGVEGREGDEQGRASTCPVASSLPRSLFTVTILDPGVYYSESKNREARRTESYPPYSSVYSFLDE